ncbi:hypothetical protein ACMD2_12363 [Ananas comosus]|uniref:Uncharacterized protein n=1 Tax=Ananas comosus TaxID=4615 RepID=A0A199V6B0_ANACO|nr:hypothetical protein ACMD2_12363 [Ananas comosus]
MLARLITMPSMPTSPLGAVNGGTGWWKGHAHWPGHWTAEFPTQMYANRPALDRGDEPWDPHRLMQKPSTATSSAVRTTLMARRGAPRRTSSTSCGSASERPSEHDSSRTCAPRVSAGNLAFDWA